MSTPNPQGDYWSLYRQLEKTISAIEATEDTGKALAVFLRSLMENYRESLGITGGRIYRRQDDVYVLTSTVGAPGKATAKVGYEIPAAYKIIRDLRERGLLIADGTDPGFDPAIEGPLEVDTFAAIKAGATDEWIISFTLAPDARKEQVLYSLSTIRHVIDSKLRDFNVQDQLQRVQEIQKSLFPRRRPEFEGYDLFGCSRPIEAVGGDVYDFISINQRILGVMVADSSGHGLAAALQTRDVVTGMRMGLAEDLKIVRVVEKLNRVINHTSLSSRFVSLLYGELETNGNFIYCNAGHVPGLWLTGDEFRLLSTGGPVLGPSPDVHYERGFVPLQKGDILTLYSDGITEAFGADEEFGSQRLQQVIRKNGHLDAESIVKAIYAAVDLHAPDDPLCDDQTVVVVKRVSNPD